MLDWNELHVEGLSLVLEVFEAAGGAGGGGLEGFLFVVGLAGDDQGPDDAGQLVGAGDDAFGFAQPAFEAAHIVAHRAIGAAQGMGRQAQDVGDAVADFAGAGLEDASAADAVVRDTGPANWQRLRRCGTFPADGCRCRLHLSARRARRR